MQLKDNLEVELKLTVRGDNPGALLDEISRLSSLGGMRLGGAQDHQLRDIYWDLPDGVLRRLRLSLRLRNIDDRQVFTVKGGTSATDGLFRRYELEVPATYENWRELQSVLSGEGVTFRAAAADGPTPNTWLRSVGLEATQDRATRRTVLYAYPVGESDQPTVELALDRTRFNFGSVHADYWEIEIEQLSEAGETVPRALGMALQERYPDRLEPSVVGKYSRGLALERELRASGQLSG